MKIAVISDIHADINKDYDVLEEISEYVKCSKSDILIVAGDISDNFLETIKSIDLLEKKSGISTYYIPGNHDMWSENLDKETTDKIYSKYIEHDKCLCEKTIYLKGKKETYALIGDIGWYDYTFADKDFSFEELEKMSFMDRIWQDSIKNQWTRNNIKKCDEMLEKLKIKLEENINYPSIVITHMLPIKEFSVQKDVMLWKYFNGFLGSERFQALYEKYNVKYSICGHVHYRKSIIKNGIMYICPCLNYYNEWIILENNKDALKTQIKEAVHFIEI